MLKKSNPIFIATALLSSTLLLVACGGGGSTTPVAKAWGTAELIETDSIGSASIPQVSVDSSGNAIAVWTTRNSIWSNRYVAGTGWGTEELIDSFGGRAFAPQVTFDGSGNALAVWAQHDGTRNNIWGNRYVASTGWGTAELLETEDIGNANIPQVGFDNNGNALAVWVQFDGLRDSIVSNRYDAGTKTWGTEELIEFDDAGDANTPQLAFDNNGNALAVWSMSDGTRTSIWSNRYVAGTGWGTEELIETDDAGNAFDPQVAIDANGNALVVWYQSDGTRLNIYSNRYIAGTGWGTAELIETDNAGPAADPQVAFNANGNALAVWAQGDGTFDNIWSNRYIAGIGWGTAELIETDNAGDASNPQVAIDANGNALAVWHQFNGTINNVWSNRFE